MKTSDVSQQCSLTDVAKIRAGNLDALSEGLFTLTDPNTRIIVLHNRKSQPSGMIQYANESPSCLVYQRPQGCRPEFGDNPSSFGRSPERWMISSELPWALSYKTWGSTNPDAGKVCELSIGVDVHLDNTVIDCGFDFIRGRAGATMEDEVAEPCPSIKVPQSERFTHRGLGFADLICAWVYSWCLARSSGLRRTFPGL